MTRDYKAAYTNDSNISENTQDFIERSKDIERLPLITEKKEKKKKSHVEKLLEKILSKRKEYDKEMIRLIQFLTVEVQAMNLMLAGDNPDKYIKIRTELWAKQYGKKTDKSANEDEDSF